MSSAVTNRTTIRSDIESILTAGLVGTGLPIQKVFDHLPSEFVDAGKTLHFTVCIVPSGTGREKQNAADEPDSTFMFNLFVSILYSRDDDSWTEEDSADRLDLVEKMITDLFADNQTATRAYLRDGQSSIELVGEEGGLAYWFETIPVRVEVYE